jgi:hypothetical protein
VSETHKAYFRTTQVSISTDLLILLFYFIPTKSINTELYALNRSDITSVFRSVAMFVIVDSRIILPA